MAADTHADVGERLDDGRTVTTRPVLLAGIVLGTAVTVLAMWNGFRLNLPDIGSFLGTVLGAIVVWLLFMAAASVLSELTVRHHRAALRHSWRHGKRGGRAAWRHGGRAYRGAASWSRPWRTRLLDGLRARWAARGSEPPISRPDATVPDPEPEPESVGPPDPAVSPQEDRRVCAACGNPEGGRFGPLVTFRETGGFIKGLHLIHLAHFEDESTGYYGQPHGPAPSDPAGNPAPTGGNTMEDPRPREQDYQRVSDYMNATASWNHRQAAREKAAHQGAARPQAGTLPGVPRTGTNPGGAWKHLTADTSEFEPEDDSALLDWMAGEVNGMSAYAEAVTDVYETGVSSIGLDPVSLAALHDYADSAAECAQAMAAARAKFASHYQEVREFAAAGGVLPHDGRWITGEGE